MTKGEAPLNSPGITKAIPPRIFALCLISASILEWVWFRDLSLLPGIPLLWHVVAGFLIGAAGFSFMGWGFFAMRDAGATVNTNKPAKAFVTSGAYRFSRNPMYVGFVSLLLGGCVMFDSLPYLLATIAMFFYLDRFVIRREEQYLRQAFRRDYSNYSSRVRRWL